MPEVELTEDEHADIQEYLSNIAGLSQQINTLVTQRGRLIRAANTAWKSAYRGAMLDEVLSKECNVPELIDESGMVGISIDKRTASWVEEDDTQYPEGFKPADCDEPSQD